MIIDMHTHIFPDELAPRAIAKLLDYSPESHNFTDGTAKGLRESMVKNGITRSVLLPVATKPSQVRIINRNCTQLSSDTFIPFGTLHPLYDKNDEEIDYLKSAGVKGIKLHPEYQDFYIEDKKYFPMYEHLAASGLIVVFHAGRDPGPFSSDHSLPGAIRNVHRNFPTLKIVAAHMGGFMTWDQSEAELASLPVYFDTSAVCDFLSPADFMRIARKHGIPHILFASDSPWFDQGTSRQWIEKLSLTSSEKDAILGENAAQLLEIL
jgi:uncharacterized protein